MNISRMDLADAGSPEKLVIEILKAEPTLTIPIPVHELALQLDITEIVPLESEGYEGGLLTTADKYNGVILFKEESEERRKRFTVGHELGHFLIPTHIPSEDGQFLCSLRDMQRLSGKEGDRRAQMEVEANRFAGLLLIPPPFLRKDLATAKDPNLEHLVRLASRYEVSKEAMARAYVQYREEAIAVVLTKDGQLLRDYRHRNFPPLTLTRQVALPRQCLLNRAPHQRGVPSAFEETDAGVWIDTRNGQTAPQLYEQVLLQRSGYAMTMLWLESSLEDDQDDEAEMTARERYRARTTRY
jgi:Zn-dependent peptidase ImmA (M78 family)